MAGTNSPLMNTPDSIRPALIPPPILLAERTVAEESLSMQFWYREAVRVQVLGVALLDVACSGTMCDGLEMYANRTLATSCPCYVHDDRVSGLCGAFRLKLTFANGEEHVIDNFTSKKFTLLFMRDRMLPRRVTASMFVVNRTVKRLYVTAVRDILDHFNLNGGCRFTGWVPHHNHNEYTCFFRSSSLFLEKVKTFNLMCASGSQHSQNLRLEGP